MDLDGACVHIRSVEHLRRAERRECEDCMKIGARWVHLRTCQDCGGTRCCDSSPNRHASAHAKQADHPVISSAEPGERWLYCFRDDEGVEY
jgi:Zn-finger in ubiquitin-hydrolases and other protein